MRPLFFLGSLFFFFPCFKIMAASGQQDEVVTAIAESWVGHDAGALLTQWPIDSGFTTFEITQRQETAYSFTFGRRAYVDSHSVSDGWSPAGTGPQGELVMQENSHTEKAYVPARIDCTATFYADVRGVISHYKFRGDSCRRYFRHWGGPK